MESCNLLDTYLSPVSKNWSHSRSQLRSGQGHGQGQGQDMVRSGQVRSNSDSHSNSKVEPDLFTKIGFHHHHHHSPTNHTISKLVFSELCDTLKCFV